LCDLVEDENVSLTYILLSGLVMYPQPKFAEFFVLSICVILQ